MPRRILQNRLKVQTFLHLAVRLIKLFSRQIHVRRRRYLQRRGWDSNPCALSDKRFSRPPRYDHFDTSPKYSTSNQCKKHFNKNGIPCQHIFQNFILAIDPCMKLSVQKVNEALFDTNMRHSRYHPAVQTIHCGTLRSAER